MVATFPSPVILMRTLQSALLLVLACACVACKPDVTTPQATAPAAAPAPAKTLGVDLTAIDKAVKPGVDFDAYANGAWRAKAAIPEDRSSTGVGLEVFQKAEKRNAELVQGLAAAKPAAGTDARRIADYYAAFMDQAGIEQRALAPLQPELDKIAAIANGTDLARVLGESLRADVDPLNATNYSTQQLFGVFVAQGLQDPTHNMAYLLQGGLGMPNRDYYLSGDADMAAIRGKYKGYVAALLKQAGMADADAKAAAIYALEEKIAKAQASIIETEDVHKANNPWPVADFAKKAPGLDWATYLQAAGLGDQQVIDAWQPGAIAKLSALTKSESLQAWKDWLAFHAINRNTAVLPKAFDDLSFGFYGTTLNGTPKQRDRWKRALSAVNGALGDAVGKLYVEKYFPASSRAQVQQLVANLLAEFPERIDKLDWKSAETKAKSKEKVAATVVGVGYPDTWRDYSALEIRPDDALGNRLRAESFEYGYQLSKLGKPLDRGEWWMTPQTVNAVNLPLQNALNFPAAILEVPFFDPNADAAANYGAIGAVIGHEISHSFDNTGAEFDAEGALRNWWTKADMDHFKAATDVLVKQYDAYEPLPGLHLNGKQVLGENIADVAGLTAAYIAYRKSLGGKEAPVMEGFTGDQRFFLAFGQAWRNKVRDAALRQQIIGDGHAPASYRAQTVRNIDPWYTAFDVKEGEKLYLKPETRVRIW
jgi:putative endopeptidase